ncbi:undecaprenyldiphospho-muramoylpentapeptide beta-N-acetylglucosaminyltransferase [Paenibacillus sp. y28]|uniref:undecaprenyldiphospho-muramoylpentapeptide beta-N-acetylglucosaminyltransferase n=1 Tax=Paenibacillus sp. y28 TaxID=3129110 RepID=UPI00301687C7
MNKIVFTGGGSAGHVTPNLALMAKLRAKGWRAEYIGSRDGIEKQIIASSGIPYHAISSGKLRRYFDLKNIKDPFRVLLGVGQAYRLLRRIKPDIVFSKGGFVSVPVVVGAWLNRIPVIIHESDLTPGLANKLSVPFAAKVCTTFPETTRHLPPGKAVSIGLPIREELLQGSKSKGLNICHFSGEKPVLLVMGGSLGAQRINEAVRAALPELLERFQVVHICGKGQLNSELERRHGYRQFEFIQEELPHILAMADVVVSRAGATSIFEFLSLSKPMLLIPLTRGQSRGDQIMNAESFERQGYAAVLPEEQLTPERLVLDVSQLYAHREQVQARMPKQAGRASAEAAVRLIEETAAKA